MRRSRSWRDRQTDWQRLAPRIGVTDDATLAIYRKRYLEGLPQRPITAEETDAAKLYDVLAKVGGAKLIGNGDKLDPGTFYKATMEN